MIAVWLLCLAVVAMAAACALLAWRVRDLADELVEERDSIHAKCIAHVASIVSNRAIAESLRRVADEWDSIEEKARIQQISRRYNPGGASVPAMWLYDRAAEIEAS